MNSQTARRREVLRVLVDRTGSTNALKRELQEFPWDSDEELVEISASHVSALLDDLLQGRVSKGEVEEWASVFEVREDVGFESDAVKEAIHRLADLYLGGDLTERSVQELLSTLE